MTNKTLNIAYDAIESIQQELCIKEVLNDAEKYFLDNSVDALKEISEELNK